jgi:hypothetical protein
MSDYEAPAITELGTVAEFTQGSSFGFNYDNQTWYGRFGFGSPRPTS